MGSHHIMPCALDLCQGSLLGANFNRTNLRAAREKSLWGRVQPFTQLHTGGIPSEVVWTMDRELRESLAIASHAARMRSPACTYMVMMIAASCRERQDPVSAVQPPAS